MTTQRQLESTDTELEIRVETEWQKLRERCSPNSLDPNEILSPNVGFFVAISRFVAIYAFCKAFIEL